MEHTAAAAAVLSLIVSSLRSGRLFDMRNGAMLKVQFSGDMLAVRPDGPITREDVATLTRAADEDLAAHPKITGVMIETWAFPGFASVPSLTTPVSSPITMPTSGVSH